MKICISASGLAFFALMPCLILSACRKPEQAVATLAQTAVDAEHKAQAAASEIDQQRTVLAAIPLPTRSMYIDIHDTNAWKNPFLTIETDVIDLRIIQANANSSGTGEGTMLRPEAARRQEIQVRPEDLAKALASLPEGAWHYGRVVAVAESPTAPKKDRAKIRQNMEAALKKLNDLGIVAEEWPAR